MTDIHTTADCRWGGWGPLSGTDYHLVYRRSEDDLNTVKRLPVGDGCEDQSVVASGMIENHAGACGGRAVGRDALESGVGIRSCTVIDGKRRGECTLTVHGSDDLVRGGRAHCDS